MGGTAVASHVRVAARAEAELMPEILNAGSGGASWIGAALSGAPALANLP